MGYVFVYIVFMFDSDLTSFYNAKYGNCFTFNSGWNRSYAIEKSSRQGPMYGK